jgi:hypothetical protein
VWAGRAGLGDHLALATEADDRSFSR